MHRRQRKLKTEQLAKVSNLVASGVEACQKVIVEAVGKSMHTLALVVMILIMCTLYFLLFSLL